MFKTVIDLLERKNFCFRSFNKLCIDFVDEIGHGDTSNLEIFQRKRLGLLKILETLEVDVRSALGHLNEAPDSAILTTPEARARINELFTEKDNLVRSILDFDLQILGHIDRIKDETIHKLQSLRSGRKTISAYRSPLDNVEAHEKKTSLDREA